MSGDKKTITVPLATLVEDMDLYPRHAVDIDYVGSLVQALESGVTLPAVTADKKSKRITDGWHRCRAYKKFLGSDATVDVEFVDYKSEADMVLDAVVRNSAHGRTLDTMDKRRSIIMLRGYGLNDAKIALAIHVPEARVQKLTIQVATTSRGAKGLVPGTSTVTLKRCVRHMEGQYLTKAQADVHAMLPGTSFLLVCRQLRRALEHNMINLEDEKLVEELRLLRDVLKEKVR